MCEAGSKTICGNGQARVAAVPGLAGLRVGVRGRGRHLRAGRGAAAATLPGWYQKLAARAGAGTLVPITGFANSVVSPAIEFKPEGWITGVGAKIFSIAGPVIAYGTLASFVWGVLYWLIGKVG